MIMYPAITQPTHARIEHVDAEDAEPPSSESIFPPLKPVIPRNFLVTDIYMEAPPAGVAAAAYDLPFRTSPAEQAASARADFLSPFRGLGSVPDELRDLLPDDCRQAFDAAVKNEEKWFAKWGDESDSTCRQEPVIDKAIVPYSMA
jgi:chromatin structure-remodeling complex protein RSC7